MLPKFVESLSGKLAEHWGANVFTPAFSFWLGGLGLRIIRFGWQGPVTKFQALTNYEQLAVILTSLVVVAISGNLIQRFDLPLLRLLEGYWGLFFKPLTQRLKQYHFNRRQRIRKSFDKLNHLPIHSLNSEQRATWLRLDWQLTHLPMQENLAMPTPLGNLMRSAEQKPYDRYGLDTLICWPYLWLLLPENARKELEIARDNLNTLVRIWFWCILFIVWSIWSWWAALAGLFAASFVYYQWIIPAAAIYTDLLVAAFTLYRLELYKSLRWPLPTSPEEERQLGLQLTEYLWRGSDDPQPKFISFESK